MLNIHNSRTASQHSSRRTSSSSNHNRSTGKLQNQTTTTSVKNNKAFRDDPLSFGRILPDSLKVINEGGGLKQKNDVKSDEELDMIHEQRALQHSLAYDMNLVPISEERPQPIMSEWLTIRFLDRYDVSD
eukprot:UN27860